LLKRFVTVAALERTNSNCLEFLSDWFNGDTRMKSRDLIFALIVIIVVGGLYYLSTRNKAKPMSARAEHATVRAREDCFQCHLPARFEELERQHKHPGKWRDARVSCLLCHKTPDGARAQRLTVDNIHQLAGLNRQNP
jgi:hypothetical protein